jgi:hypothetical protein
VSEFLENVTVKSEEVFAGMALSGSLFLPYYFTFGIEMPAAL